MRVNIEVSDWEMRDTIEKVVREEVKGRAGKLVDERLEQLKKDDYFVEALTHAFKEIAFDHGRVSNLLQAKVDDIVKGITDEDIKNALITHMMRRIQ